MRYGPLDLMWWLGQWIASLSWGLWISVGLMLLSLPLLLLAWEMLRPEKKKAPPAPRADDAI